MNERLKKEFISALTLLSNPTIITIITIDGIKYVKYTDNRYNIIFDDKTELTISEFQDRLYAFFEVNLDYTKFKNLWLKIAEKYNRPIPIEIINTKWEGKTAFNNSINNPEVVRKLCNNIKNRQNNCIMKEKVIIQPCTGPCNDMGTIKYKYPLYKEASANGACPRKDILYTDDCYVMCS